MRKCRHIFSHMTRKKKKKKSDDANQEEHRDDAGEEDVLFSLVSSKIALTKRPLSSSKHDT